MAAVSVAPFATVIKAPPRWHSIDFISDLHLQASRPDTLQAWQRYMAQTKADAVFILGDLFEVWVGDDAATAQAGNALHLETLCQQVLSASARRLALYFIHGNRDFLLGQMYAQACNMRLLPDPCVLDFDHQRWLLSHGDELCLSDSDYQQFRAMVRSTEWQNSFLAKPLTERQKIAQGLRKQSEARKSSGTSYADIDSTAARQWLTQANATTLIHGHTHRPGNQVLTPTEAPAAPPLYRLVLSDWDASATPARLQILRLCVGQQAQRLTLDSGFE